MKRVPNIYQYRATQLESYRRFVMDEYTTHEEMIQSLMGTRVESDAMRFGTTIHKLIEQAHAGQLPDNIGNMFDVDSLKHCVDILTPAATCELRSEKVAHQREYEIIKIRGTADAVIGTRIVDFKTTLSSISERKIQAYEDSMQWKVYLWLFGGTTFEFVIHQWAENDGVYRIANEEIVRCYAYSNMENDIYSWLNRLHYYAISNGIHCFENGTINVFDKLMEAR